MLLGKRDEAINARQLLLDAGVSTKPGLDLVNLVKTVLADVAWLTESHAKVCAQRNEALDELDAARARSAAEQDVIDAAKLWRARVGASILGAYEVPLVAAVDALYPVAPGGDEEVRLVAVPDREHGRRLVEEVDVALPAERREMRRSDRTPTRGAPTRGDEGGTKP
jgi:hypothetical protein